MEHYGSKDSYCLSLTINIKLIKKFPEQPVCTFTIDLKMKPCMSATNDLVMLRNYTAVSI